eukprot:4315588-Pyramimonas_sp.AAC.1
MYGKKKPTTVSGVAVFGRSCATPAPAPLSHVRAALSCASASLSRATSHARLTCTQRLARLCKHHVCAAPLLLRRVRSSTHLQQEMVRFHDVNVLLFDHLLEPAQCVQPFEKDSEIVPSMTTLRIRARHVCAIWRSFPMPPGRPWHRLLMARGGQIGGYVPVLGSLCALATQERALKSTHVLLAVAVRRDIQDASW